jgi:hypothetical protein
VDTVPRREHTIVSRALAAVGSLGSFTIAAGLQMSGYINPPLGIALVAIGVILAIVAMSGFLGPALRSRTGGLSPRRIGLAVEVLPPIATIDPFDDTVTREAAPVYRVSNDGTVFARFGLRLENRGKRPLSIERAWLELREPTPWWRERFLTSRQVVREDRRGEPVVRYLDPGETGYEEFVARDTTPSASSLPRQSRLYLVLEENHRSRPIDVFLTTVQRVG